MSAHPSAEQLSAFLDEELPDADRRALEEHLRTCDACAAHLGELAAVDDAARALPVQEPAGYFDDFAARVRARVDTRRPRRTLPVWSWAAAAAVLLAVVTPLALRERAAQAPAEATVREAPARAAQVVPPPAAAKPQAPPADAGPGATTEGADLGFADEGGRRANEAKQRDRLQRRDRPAGNGLQLEERLSQDKAEQASEPAPETAAAARLEEQSAEKLKSLGYVAPPAAASQRPHGPRSQQQYAPPPPPAPSAAEIMVDQTLGGVGGDTEAAREKDDRSALAKRSAPPGQEAAAGGAAGAVAAESRVGAGASVKRAAPVPNGDEARRRREAFRRMANEQRDGTSADVARVGVIEEGVRAYRLEGRAEDRTTAERDGRAYLARPDALQAPRVRALLKELEAPR